MARRVFFSFHYERDIWRASVVRNSWVTKTDREAAGFWDAADWEKVKKRGDRAVKEWIDAQMAGTSVTAVLIGAQTSGRRWVRYEVKRSHEQGKGMLALYIHGIDDRHGSSDDQGSNQFGPIAVDASGQDVYFWQLYPTYDWVVDDGYSNFGHWVEQAAARAGR